MTAGLHIGTRPLTGTLTPEEVVLPLDIITQSTGVLAKKGAGKTNLGVVIVEEAHAAKVPVVVVDPKGDWYGIRSGTDGDPKGGLPIPVFGGLHGDIPLEPTAGAYLADLVREKGLSVVLDVSEFSGADRRRFLTAFADRLYRIDSREPMLLMLEEAHEYIPQGVTGEDAKMVGVFERIVKLGRWKGIGIMMMTQRSASLNKNVLTQVDNLFMLRTGSPQDRAAVQAWISGHGDAKEIIDSLPGLATGEFWLWQPERGEPVRGRARMRRTYDAGQTPKIGEKPRPPATLADVNLSEIASAMHETIERAKADDPVELRRQIKALQATLAAIPAGSVGTPEPVIVEVEKVVEVVPPEYLVTLQRVKDDILGAHKMLAEHMEKIELYPVPSSKPRSARPLVSRESAPMTPQPAPAAVEARDSRADRALSPTEQKVLAALATRAGFPDRTLTATQIALRAGVSKTSSSYVGGLRNLVHDGLIESPARKVYSITDAGASRVGPIELPPTDGAGLLEWWAVRLPPTQVAILRELVAVHPGSLPSEVIAQQTGFSPTSSSFVGGFRELVKQDLIYGMSSAWRVSDEFGM